MRFLACANLHSSGSYWQGKNDTMGHDMLRLQRAMPVSGNRLCTEQRALLLHTSTASHQFTCNHFDTPFSCF